MKLEIDTLKELLKESSIIYLTKDQTLYRQSSPDQFIYFVLFGKLILLLPTGHIRPMTDDNLSVKTSVALGKVNIGWTLGEEILYNPNVERRMETCVARAETCLLGIQKNKYANILKVLMEQGKEKDLYVLESVL